MWYEEFLKWLATLPQGTASFLGTLAGSSLGLIAILIGALVNASLNRRRDDRLQKHDRVALASTLYAELSGIHESFVENAASLRDRPPEPDHGFVVPGITIKLLPKVIPRLGLLKPDAIGAVMRAYVLAEQYAQHLILAGGQRHQNMPDGSVMIYFDARHAVFVADLASSRSEVVQRAIDAVAPYLKL